MKTQFTPRLKYAIFFASLFLMTFCVLFAKAQNDNFYSQVVKQDRYFDSLMKVRGNGNMKGTGYKPYLRWKLYWLGKVGSKGSIYDAYNAMLNYTNNFGTIKGNFVTTTNIWKSLGPFTWPNNVNYYDTLNLTGTIGVGRIHALAFDPSNNNRVYAMSPSWGGLYRSDNYGTSWSKVPTNNIPGEGFGWVLVDNTNSNILYLVNGDSDGNYYTENCLSFCGGIYRSTDGGNSWLQIFHTPSAYSHKFIRKIVMDPNNHNTILVATDYGLYKCDSALASNPNFIKKLDSSFIDIEYRAGSNNEVYVSGRHQDYLYKSIDDGNTWGKITNPYIATDTIRFSNIEVSAADPNTLYFLSENQVQGYLNTFNILYLMNTNTGVWQKKANLLNVNGLAKGFAVSPTNANLIFAGAMNNYPIYKSSDMGNTFIAMPNYYHVDIHHLDFSNTGDLWAGTDGGIHKYITAANSWSDLTNMSISNIGKYSFTIAQSDTNFLVMGGYDVGSNLLNKSAGTNPWRNIGSGDGTACVYDYADANTLYYSDQGGKITRYDRIHNTGYTLAPIVDNNKAYNSLVIDAGNHNLIYMITDSSVYRSFARGDNGTWKKISGNLNTGNALPSFYHLFTSATTPGVLYLQNLYYHDAITNKTYHKIWRTFNANVSDESQVTWEPYTFSDTILFNGIALDPLNPRRGWASVQGWADPRKIMQFSETGWQDISYNLNSLIPVVVSLAYDRASSTGRLYVGTWDGIFYLDKGTTQWKLLDGMPEAEITNLEIQYISGKLFTSSYGKGVWETSIHNTACTGPIAINNDSTLLIGGMSLCDIVVKAGKTFTVKGLLSMGQNTKIIVERGAKLIVDGGKITGLPGFMWKGIEVWGDSSKTQASSGIYQGLAKFINKAVIENAKTAVVTVRNDGTPNYAYTGGIVQGTDATFHNCTYGVVFYKYENRNPLTNKTIDNASAFTRCVFETTGDYISTDTIRDFISLSQVRGISFYGCTFTNTSTKFGGKNTGIFAYNSGFRVLPICNSINLPCQSIQRTIFSGLRYGVRALGSATTKTFSVENSDFTANICGLYFNAIDFARIIQNTFNVPRQDTSITSVNASGGVFAEQCKFYTIEENTFNKINSPGGITSKYVGLTISNSGTDNNQVYKNTFNNLDIGILAQGKNRKTGTNEGLCLRCNNFNNLIRDIAVTRPANASLDLNGIAKWQGSSYYPAGNLFSSFTTPPTDFSNYFNIQKTGIPTAYIITYFHHTETGPYNTIPDSRWNVSISNTNKQYGPDTCASHLNGGISSYSAKMVQTDNFADEKVNELAALVDGGETFEMVSEVVYSYPAEALQLRDQLLQQSPYLSDTVLSSAIEKENVLNNAMVRDVLVANPQSAKSVELMQKLDERWETMPEYMKDEIAEGAVIVSPKEQLEADITMAKAESEGWYNRLIGETLRDTSSYTQENLAGLLEVRQRAANDYMKVIYAYETGNVQSGLNTLESIPALYGYNEQQMVDHNKFTEFYQLLADAQLNIRPIQLIDSTEAISFSNHITNITFLQENWLRNSLLAAGKLNYMEQYILPDVTKSEIAGIPKKKSTKTNEYIKLFPNPANDYLVIEYKVSNNENSKIMITDMMGKQVDQIILPKTADQIIYVTSKLIAGAYNCSLYIDNDRKFTVTFSVIR